MHDNDAPLLDVEEKQSWVEYLTQFDRDVWPTMKQHVPDKGVALTVFSINRVLNKLVDVENQLVERLEGEG